MKSVFCAVISFGICFEAGAVSLKVTNQPGTYVRTSTGTVTLNISVDGAIPPEGRIEVGLSEADGARKHFRTFRPAPGSASTSLSAEIPLETYGTRFVDAVLRVGREGDAIATASATIAAIPDNRRFAPDGDSPFGMGCYFGMRFSPWQLEIASRLAGIAGVAWTREELRWDICEPARGRYEWTKFDRAIEACRNHHISVLGLLDYWGAYQSGTTTMTQQALNDFAAYVDRTVRRYTPSGDLSSSRNWRDGFGIRHWEIWNEPATFWAQTPEEFGRLTAAASGAVRAADPAAVPFFSNAGEVFDSIALEAMGGVPFGGVTPHFYMPPRSPHEGKLEQGMARQRRFFESRGIRVPYFISEIGWHTDHRPARQLDQANYLVQSYVIALATGYDKVFWYNFVCDSEDPKSSEYGLLTRPDFMPRISFAAFAGMAHSLEGVRFMKPLPLGRNVSAYLFRTPDGKELAALWCESEEGTLTLSQRGLSGGDMFGNPMPGVANGEIPLRRSPCFVRAGSGLESALRRGILAGIPQIELSLQSPAGRIRSGSVLRFAVENFTDSAIRGALEFESAALGIEAPDSFSVGRESSTTVEARVARIKPSSDNTYPLRVKCALSGGEVLTRNFVLSQKVAAHGTATIDGVMDEWRNAAPLRLASAEQAVGITPWMDWNLSADYFLMWDRDHLYFAGRVHDNAHSQPHAGKLIWEGDSWQLGIDAVVDRRAGSPLIPDTGAYCYGLALTEKGPESVSWEGRGSADGIRLAIRRVPAAIGAETPGGPPVHDELVYECAIPAERLKPLKLKAGERFRFSVLLNDNDGGGRAGWMESTPGIGTGFNPSLFDVFELE